MVIPQLRPDGTLPPGRFQITGCDELFVAFPAATEQRRILNEELVRLVDTIRRLGLGLRLVIDGSYTTEKAEPDDIDIALFSSGLDETDTLQRLREEMINLDLLDVFVDTTEHGFEKMADFFAHDRAGDPKGIIVLVV